MNDDLDRRLRAADPAAALPAAGPERVARLLEDTMDDQTTLNETTPTQTTTRRSRLPWLAAAAAVVLVAVLGFQTLGNDSTPTATDSPSSPSPSSSSPSPDAATTQTLVVGEGAETAGKCLVPSAEYLSGSATAFAGTVTGLADGLATLSVDRWYAGDESDEVVVRAPSEDMQALLSAVSFEEGGHYLVAADETGSVMLCGFSAPYDDALAAMYAEAFGG